MALIPFNLADSLISYSDDRRARRIACSFDEFQNPEHDYLLIVFDFEDDRSVHAGMAKARASEAARLAGRVALQVHGAIGYTTEYDLHLFMKRAWALAASWGDAAWHVDRVGRAILDTDPTPEEH